MPAGPSDISKGTEALLVNFVADEEAISDTLEYMKALKSDILDRIAYEKKMIQKDKRRR
ncbi:unnamed protein product [Arabis nemorensis]|uniref:Uncharacterized protein n=1 Tax=Arabis nemorensis TaxID=586526 RepID=A0A565C009_9BRAS|nr:unnamed protein product [Arabis nemorensis]